jgi:hypothetical protein
MLLVDCPIVNNPRRQLFHELNLITNFENTFQTLNLNSKISTLLFGDERFSHHNNVLIVTHTAKLIASIFNVEDR